MRENLIETADLAARLDDPELFILDGSWHLPNSGRNGFEEYLNQHIPGAQFFDIDAISDRDTDLPHMVPQAEAFAEALGAMGLRENMDVVVYDSAGLFSAARVWWTCKIMGLNTVRVLNGGLPKWIAEQRPVDTGKPSNETAAKLSITLDRTRIRDYDDMCQAADNPHVQVIDARPAPRFNGAAPEPRPELQSGHMPGSLNLHYASLLDANGTLKQNDILRQLFASAGADLSKPIVTSCGSGVTAAILTLALHELGHTDNALYDGSWTDWASRPGSKIIGNSAG